MMIGRGRSVAGALAKTAGKCGNLRGGVHPAPPKSTPIVIEIAPLIPLLDK
jgi:hypothetical protein